MIEPGARHRLPQKARLVVEVVSVYAVTQWSLRRHGLHAAVERVRSVEPKGSVPGASDPTAYGYRLGVVVSRILGVLPTDTRCLARSLVLMHVLARRGVRASLVIGAASQPEFRAHAWLEYNSRPLLPTGGDDFKRLLTL